MKIIVTIKCDTGQHWQYLGCFISGGIKMLWQLEALCKSKWVGDPDQCQPLNEAFSKMMNEAEAVVMCCLSNGISNSILSKILWQLWGGRARKVFAASCLDNGIPTGSACRGC